MQRITTIDFTRGLVMIIMALDHVRDLMHSTSLTQNPTDLTTTTAGLFATRWITHLCAPTFVFLSGTSAYLSLQNSGNTAANQRFLRTRGLWLILLEFTLINFALWFDLQFRILAMQVIAAIGFGLFVLSFCLKLPTRVLLYLGLGIIFLHNLLQGVSFADKTALNFVWSVFFRPGVFPLSEQFMFAVLYPLVPWLGILLFGYGLGPVFTQVASKRRSDLLKLGGLALGLFILVRFFNSYGDPAPWSTQKDVFFTLLSYINTTKYPPSLLYTAMTLGISFFIMALADGVRNRFTETVSIYGKVPLFYYLLHWYIIHSLMVLLMFAQGFSWAELSFAPFSFGRPKAPSGVGLETIYLIWLGVVIALYPLCRWYWSYKSTHKSVWWLRYS